MSKHKLQARDKQTLKNTRDGLVERNIVTGEDVKVTQREAEQNLQTIKPQDDLRLSKAMTSANTNNNHPQRQYQWGNDSLQKHATLDNQNPTTIQAQQADAVIPTVNAESNDIRPDEHNLQLQSGTDRVFYSSPKSKSPRNFKRQYENYDTHRNAQAQNKEPQARHGESQSENNEQQPEHRKSRPEQRNLQLDHGESSQNHNLQVDAQSKSSIAEPDFNNSPLRVDAPSKLHSEASQSALQTMTDNATRHVNGRSKKHRGKHRKRRHHSKGQSDASRKVNTGSSQNTDVSVDLETSQSGTSPKSQPESQSTHFQQSNPTISTSSLQQSPSKQPSCVPQSQLNPSQSPFQQSKPDSLRFAEDEIASSFSAISDAKQTKKLGKAQTQADQATAKLDKAKAKLSTKKRLRSKRMISDQTSKANRKLYFESGAKNQSKHLGNALQLRPIKMAGNMTSVNAHRKLYQVEQENVATEAAHKGEMLAEGSVRSALRFSKTAPYRKVEKLERAATKKSVNLTYQKALSENPKLQSNVFSRMAQKRKIKKDYAIAAREAKRNAQRVKKVGSKVSDATKALGGVVKRHPVAATVVALICLMMFGLTSLVGAFGGLGSGGLGGILSASYVADDLSIDSAELSYTEWETDLQEQIERTESDRPGYDEYRYQVGGISHNPYELMAYLTVKYQDFSYNAISSDLQALFAEQYNLTYTPTSETRYDDPTDADEDGDYEPYEYKIMTVTLTAKNFSEVVAGHLSSEEAAQFTLLLETKGSRQYLANPFDFEWLSYVSSNYGYRVHPISGAKDLHRGVDIALPQGTAIHAGQDGTVTFAGYSGDYGNVVVIENEDGLVSKYTHCDSLSITVGQSVKTGDIIATVGNTGNSTGSHLHLEVMKGGEYLNPIYFADTGTYNPVATYSYAGEPMGDDSFTTLMAVARQFAGFPYVWGGSSPETSFDCSGLVSYCLRASGVADVGRLTAQGLYNLCTPVSTSEAKPGDLVFYHSTYSSATPISHVGIYCGDNLMFDAGDPIGYTSINTAYWQSHFYAFARLT